MTDTVANDITAKVGPLPAWAWGAGLVGGFLLWRHHATTAMTPTADPGTDPSASDATTTDLTGGSYGVPASPGASYDPFSSLSTGTAPGYGSTSYGSTGLPGPQNDAQWSTLAANYLMGQGQDPSTVQTALNKYLNGATLTATEQAVINAALRVFGSPPEGTIPVVVVGPAPDTTTDQGGTSTTGGSTTPVTPSPTPTPVPSPRAPAAPHVTGQATATHQAVMSWAPVPGAVLYACYYNGKLARLQRGTKYSSGVYRHGFHYGPFQVKAFGSTGLSGPLSNKVTVTIR